MERHVSMSEEVGEQILEVREMMGINPNGTEGRRIQEFLIPDDTVSWKVEVDGASYHGARTIHNLRYAGSDSELYAAGLWLPSRGGFRIADLSNPDVYGPEGSTPDEMSRFLAIEMALKLLPLLESGGAKSVMDVPANRIADAEFMTEVCRQTVQTLHAMGHYDKYRNASGMPTDIWAPDMNTLPYIDAMVEELTRLTGDPRLAQTFFTGKKAGGHPEREAATGRGAAMALPMLIDKNPVLQGKFTKDKPVRVVQQGLGNVGWYMMDTLHDYMPNAQISAVSEFDGTLIDTTGEGLPVKEIINSRPRDPKVRPRPLKEWQRRGIAYTRIPQAVFGVPGDVMSLGYDKNQIHEGNVDLVDPEIKVMFPVSNGGVSPGAIGTLVNRLVVVAPDFAINSSGTVGSQMETYTSWTGKTISVAQFRQQLRKSMELVLDGTINAAIIHEQPGDRLWYDMGKAATAAALNQLLLDAA